MAPIFVESWLVYARDSSDHNDPDIFEYATGYILQNSTRQGLYPSNYQISSHSEQEKLYTFHGRDRYTEIDIIKLCRDRHNKDLKKFNIRIAYYASNTHTRRLLYQRRKLSLYITCRY